MLGGVSDAEGHLPAALAARAHRVVVIEDAALARQLEKRCVRHGRAPADVADIDHARRRGRVRREAENVDGERQIGARPADHPRHVLRGVAHPDEEMVELSEQLEQVLGHLLHPDLADEAGCHPAALPPSGHGGEREDLERVVEDRKEELVLAREPGNVETRRDRPRELPRAGRQPRKLVHAAGELDGAVILGLGPIGLGDLGGHVLELVRRAERDEVVDPTHRELQDVPHQLIDLRDRATRAEGPMPLACLWGRVITAATPIPSRLDFVV